VAPLNFPNSPTDGQTFGAYTWSASRGAWLQTNMSSRVVAVSDNAPTSPYNGDMWYNSSDGNLYVYYNDTTSNQWVQIKTNSSLYSTIGNNVDSLALRSPNYIINSAFDFWQRGSASASVTDNYKADRWKTDGTATVARTTGTAGIQYAIGITGSSGNPAIRQGIELPEAGAAGQFISGSTWTLSFYAKTSTSVSANYALYAAFVDNVITQANAVSVVSATTGIGSASTSWTRYSYTFTVGASPAGTNTSFMVVPYLNSGAYAGTLSITGVQLEAGSVAGTFRRNGNSIQAELAACQRYYWRVHGKTSTNWVVGMTYGLSSTTGTSWVQFPVSMRTAPPTTQSLSGLYGNNLTGANSTISSATFNGDVDGGRISWTGTSWSGGTWYMVQGTGSTSYLDFSAEL